MSAAPRQLRLFKLPSPLVARWGPDFFKDLPESPGVYLMYDDGGRLIYVGKARNLRRRVGSYRHAAPGRNSRKTIRLVHAAARLEWEICPSETAALLRENALLREHRPRFNRANTWPAASVFLTLQRENGALTLGWVSEPVDSAECFGAFKRSSLAALLSLQRLLWAACHPGMSCDRWPRELWGGRPRPAWTFPRPAVEQADWSDTIAPLLAGASDKLIAHLETRLAADPPPSTFESRLRAGDLEVLRLFYLRSSSRLRALRQAKGLPAGLIAKDVLDDLLVEFPTLQESDLA